MPKNKIIHSKMLLQKIKEDNTGVFVLDTSSGEFVRPVFNSLIGPDVSSFDYNTSFDYYKSFGGEDKCGLCDYIMLYVRKYKNTSLHDKREIFRVYRRSGNAEVWLGRLHPTSSMDVSKIIKVCGTDTYEQTGRRDIVSEKVEAYAIDDEGNLYIISDDDINKYTGRTGWTDICGTVDYFAETCWTYAYGICNGKLYKIGLSSSGVPTFSQVGSSTKWTSVQGMTISKSGGGHSTQIYGINDGKIYTITPENGAVQYSTQYTSLRIVKIVNSTLNDAAHHFLCIADNGNLYVVLTDGYFALTRFSENSISDIAANYVISNGELFYIDSSDRVRVHQVGTSDKWTKITGQTYAGNETYGDKSGVYGICNGVLYQISMNVEDDEYEFTLTEMLRNCVGVYGAGKVIALCNIN